MKRLISICSLLFFVVLGNAQENNKAKLNEFNQDQLNLALKQSLKTIKTGKILTFVGVGSAAIGFVLTANSARDIITGSDEAENKAVAGEILFFGGCASIAIGVPVWIVGANKKNKVELELVKFNPKGSASINGIGLIIRF